MGDNFVRKKNVNFFLFLNQGAGFFQMTATERAFSHSCQLLQLLRGWQTCQHPNTRFKQKFYL